MRRELERRQGQGLGRRLLGPRPGPERRPGLGPRRELERRRPGPGRRRELERRRPEPERRQRELVRRQGPGRRREPERRPGLVRRLVLGRLV